MATVYLHPISTISNTWPLTPGAGESAHQDIDDGVDPPGDPGNADYLRGEEFNCSGAFGLAAPPAGTYTAVAIYANENAGMDINNIDAYDISIDGGTTWLGRKTFALTAVQKWDNSSDYAINTTNINVALWMRNNDGTMYIYAACAKVTYTAAAPEMNVQGNGVSIVDGDDTPAVADDTDFGNVNVGSTHDHIFTIQNTGTANLNLTATPIIAVRDFPGGGVSTEYAVQSNATTPVTPAGSTTFTIRFTPTGAGAKVATLSIPNDDADENPYNWYITGTGVAVGGAGEAVHKKGMLGVF